MILRFPSSAARSVFLNRMHGLGSVEKVRFKASFSEPTVVIVRGTSDQVLRSELQPYLGADVEIFDDVQFSVMRPGP